MNTFCPFFKDVCRGNECVMFKNGECLIVAFLQNLSEETPQSEGLLETSGFELRQETDVPNWLETKTAEEIAEDILEFKKKTFPEEESLSIYTVTNFFWERQGIEQFHMPSEIRLKIQQADTLAQIMARKEQEKMKNERMEKETAELPSLVSRCVDWARTNGLKRVTVADVDAYILERNLDILKETRRAIYAKTNVELKSRR
jgi:hypothetical protein